MGLGCLKTLRCEEPIEWIFLRIAVGLMRVVERSRLRSVRKKSSSSFSIARCFYTGRLYTISHSPPDRKVVVFGKQEFRRRQASRFAGRAANEIPAGHQPQDRKGARDRNSANPARDGQPGDRMNRNCPRYASAAIGNHSLHAAEI